MRKIFIPLFLIIIAGYGCSDPLKPKSNEFVVKGKLKNTKGESIYIEELLINKTQTIDSTRFNEDGEFFFKHTITEPGFYLLKVKNKNFITLLIQPEDALTLDGDALQLERTYTVSGSDESKKICELYLYYYKNAAKVDSLKKIFIESQNKSEFPEIKNKLDSSFHEIYKDQQKYIKQFINANSGSMASILALFQSFGKKRLITDDEEIEFSEKIDHALFSKYPKNKHVINLHERLAKLKRDEAEKKLIEQRLLIGAIAPNFVLPNIKGDTVSLLSLRGKYVLLNFWSPQCEDCIQETKYSKWVYKTFHKKGFEILSIAIDENKERWKKAINDLYLPWIQVNDYNDMAGPVITLYNVKKIPYNILIDPNGIIISKGISGEELSQKLYEIFGNQKNTDEDKKSDSSLIKTK